MPVIFSRNVDSYVRHGVMGVALSAAMTAAGIYYYAYPQYTRVGYAPEQPVPFSHELHAGNLGIDCRYCHQNVDKSPHASVPTAETCMNCHNPAKANVKGNSPLLSPVRESYAGGNPVPWKRIHKLPEYSYFNHSVHVTRGVSCVECHGPINEMKVVYHHQPLTMGWCLDCHNNPKTHLREPKDVYNLALYKDAKEEDKAKVGETIQKRFQINPPQTCQGCHR